MELKDITLLQVVDSHHIDELIYSWETWKKYKPEICELPLMLVYDSDCGSDLHKLSHITNINTEFYEFKNKKYYSSQRDAMITSFFEGVRKIKTKYYLKLDTDCVANDDSKDWISAISDRDEYRFISKGWSLSRKDYIKMIEKWCSINYPDKKILEGFTEKGEKKLRKNRIISWFFLGNVEWNLKISEKCWRDDHYELACPSHDTFLWYMAEFFGDKYKREDFKKMGFHHGRLKI